MVFYDIIVLSHSDTRVKLLDSVCIEIDADVIAVNAHNLPTPSLVCSSFHSFSYSAFTLGHVTCPVMCPSVKAL